MRKLAAVGIALVLAFGACSNDSEGRGDADVKEWDDSPAYAINFPDSFMNVSVKCDPHGPGYRIFTHTRQAPPVIFVDSTCKGKAS